MNITSYTKVNQLIPVSQARASLPSLLEEVSKKDFFVLVKKYKPKAVLADLRFFEKLIEVYEKWKRKQDFALLKEIRQSVPVYKSKEVEKDIKNALQAVRKQD